MIADTNMIIDTHVHVWSDDFSQYPFTEGQALIEGAPAKLLLEKMADAGVDRAVIVQPIHYRYDNRDVADCLKRFPGKFAAIGLVDRHAPDAPKQLRRLVEEDGFGGLRIHMSLPDDPSEWAAASQDPIWRQAEALGTCFLVHGPASLLPALAPIIARFPNVNVVLDHIGGAPTDEAPHCPKLHHVLDLARYPNVHVKFTPQGHKSSLPYPHEDTLSTFKRIFDVYGPERLLWGTNFPGILKSTGYRPSLELFQKHMDFLTDDDKEWLFSKTARKVWKSISE